MLIYTVIVFKQDVIVEVRNFLTPYQAQIFLASDTIDNEQEAKVVISHELVHALTREFYFYYSYFTSNKIDINICSAAFETAEEAIAERLSKLILILYEARI